MTENEALKNINEFGIRLGAGDYIDLEALRIAGKALEEIQEYRAIGTIEECALFKGISEKDLSTSFLDLKMIKELHEYKKIGTVNECQEAREKQKEKKCKKIQPCKSVNYYQCPCCNGLLHMNENFCGECGQAILWEDEECLT